MPAKCGMCSQTSMPGTTVRIGWNRLRTPTGESGFMSHISCCGGPPHRYIRMHDFAVPLVTRNESPLAVADCERNNCGNVQPAEADPAQPQHRIPSVKHSIS